MAMKKVCLILILCALSLYPCENSKANATTLTYALIKENAVLYKSDASGYFAVTSLPKNYFVVVTGEETEGYVPVSYLDIEGFVASQKLEFVDYEPKYKFAENNVLTATNDGHEVNVRISPTSIYDNVIAELESGDTVYYYGKINGQAQISALGDEWYYVRFSKGTSTVRGYVYSLYADAMPIKENVIERIDPPVLTPDENFEQITETQSYSDVREIVIIVSLCLPVLVVMYLIFHRPENTQRR